MAALLTPGVFIREVAFGPSPISGVSTSVAGFVGEAQRGPVDGAPLLVTSFADFQRRFGDFVAQKYLAYAVQGFFSNGGQQAFIARVVNTATASQASVIPQLGYDAAILSFSTVSVNANTDFTVRASTVVGLQDASVIELIDKGGTHKATLTVQTGGINPTAGTLVVRSDVSLGTPPLKASSFALRYDPVPASQTGTPFTFTARDPGAFGNDVRVRLTPTYLATAVVSSAVSATQYVLNTVEPFAVGSFVEMARGSTGTSAGAREIESLNAVDATTNRITLGGGATTFQPGDFVRALGWTLEVYYAGALVETLTGITSNNTGSDGLSSISVNSQWIRVPADTTTYPSFSLSPVADHAVVTGTVNLAAVLAALGAQTLTLSTDSSAPVDITFGTPTSAADVLTMINGVTGAALVATTNLGNELVLTSQTSGPTARVNVVGGSAVSILGLTTGSFAEPESPSYLLFPGGDPIALANGTNGNAATPNDVIGSDTPPRSGLKALEAQEGISIIAAPGFPSGGGNGIDDAVVGELIGQAERKKDRFAVFETVDGPNVDVNALLQERGKWNSQYAAMYAPWVQVLDPLTGTTINVPPSGHVIGAYANTDGLRGVFKAPANVVIQGITGFSRDIPTGEQDLLNPADVNVLRNFPGLGNVIWGARTIAADPLWRYISVRRLFIFLEQSIIQGTRYAVFEPNDLRLWARLRDSVKNFLTTQWRAGALFGDTPKEAFFVRVDETTTTQDDRDNGIVNILVGIAPVKPAEFIVFQIGQAPASVILAEQS
jgi:phage tail sheath protein FI